MKWIEIKVVFDPGDHDMIDELIASVFEDADTGGVSVERPDMEPEEGWDPGPVSKHSQYAVKGYIPADDEADATCRIIEEGIGQLKNQGFNLELSYGVMDDENWSESWKEYFHAERIGERIVVKPTWREYTPLENDIILEIDPGMAFGTGTHPTTSMCVRLLEKHLKPGNTVLDIGTGSGILMIAAHNLGAGPMTGTDIDPVAVETAEKNLALNRVPGSRYTLITGNLSDAVNDRFQVVVANILSEVILILLDDLHAVMAENGLFICSGILEEQAPAVIEKMKAKGFTIVQTLNKNAWSAIVGQYKG